jgi:hypothetical protein
VPGVRARLSPAFASFLDRKGGQGTQVEGVGRFRKQSFRLLAMILYLQRGRFDCHCFPSRFEPEVRGRHRQLRLS